MSDCLALAQTGLDLSPTLLLTGFALAAGGASLLLFRRKDTRERTRGRRAGLAFGTALLVGLTSFSGIALADPASAATDCHAQTETVVPTDLVAPVAPVAPTAPIAPVDNPQGPPVEPVTEPEPIDLALQMTATPDVLDPAAPTPGTINLTVGNVSSTTRSTTGTTIRISRYGGLLTAPVVTDPAWTVTSNANFVTLTYSGIIPAGATTEVTLNVVWAPAARNTAGTIAAVISSGSGGDTNPANNSAIAPISWPAPVDPVLPVDPIVPTPIDLTPTIASNPSHFDADGNGVLHITLQNLSSDQASQESPVVRVRKNSKISNVALVPGSNFTIDATSDPSYYLLTHAGAVAPGSTATLDLSYDLVLGGASGSLSILASIPAGTGGDTNVLNNTSSTEVTFGQ